MAIVFNCEHCGKEIRAADSAGGKWGKCPNCQHKLYVPSPETGEELKLAPEDNTDLEREKQLMAETYRLTQEILKEREIPDGPAIPAGAVYDMSEQELRKNIILFIRQMEDGELDEAERTAALISPHKNKVTEILDRIALSEIPEPELSDIAPQVLSGLIRTLRSKIE
jgi:DNA-directed RNA polymerase subunit RPC12/RpoP